MRHRWENIRKNIECQKGDVFLIIQAHIAKRGRSAKTGYHPKALSPNKWHHIAFQSNGHQITTIVNDFAHIQHLPQNATLAADLSSIERPKDFTLGGFGEKIGSRHHDHFWGAFAGYIDEVRISRVARYDVAKEGFTPRGAFKNDAKTVALWHFDEPGGTGEFSDASGNAYHLAGKNGAKTGTPLAIEAQ